jgi:exonuclease VII large subunit
MDENTEAPPRVAKENPITDYTTMIEYVRDNIYQSPVETMENAIKFYEQDGNQGHTRRHSTIYSFSLALKWAVARIVEQGDKIDGLTEQLAGISTPDTKTGEGVDDLLSSEPTEESNVAELLVKQAKQISALQKKVQALTPAKAKRKGDRLKTAPKPRNSAKSNI